MWIREQTQQSISAIDWVNTDVRCNTTLVPMWRNVARDRARDTSLTSSWIQVSVRALESLETVHFGILRAPANHASCSLQWKHLRLSPGESHHFAGSATSSCWQNYKGHIHEHPRDHLCLPRHKMEENWDFKALIQRPENRLFFSM